MGRGEDNVVVVGSGAAGLAAALAAADAGADVTLLEHADHVGGTTAISGGVAWIPANHLSAAAGLDDTADDALRYLRAIGGGDYDDALVQVFVHEAAGVACSIEESTRLRWSLLADWPDYQAEFPGGRPGGRSIWPEPLEFPAAVGDLVQMTPESPDPRPVPGTDGRVTDAVVFRGPVRGRVLVGAMLEAVLERGVTVEVGVSVDGLLVEDGVVRGVRAAGVDRLGRVVLATGGFQHDPALARTFLPGPPEALAPMGTPGCTGDALRFTAGLGVALGNMSEAWWMPAVCVPGETLNGAPFYRPLHHERAQPGALMVDRGGRRFVDEAQNYGDVGRSMLRFDAGSFGYPAAPCWLVFDSAYRRRTPLGPIGPNDPDPPWMRTADTVDALGDGLGLPPGSLARTVAEFNADAASGVDTRFGRGDHVYDRWIGDARAEHPTLAALSAPPFYAVEVRPGCLGTKGGPRTDASGRVRRNGGGIVVGLYAAGNAAASPFGIATAGGGSTIGPALVFGTRAGVAAATDATVRR
jgi:succinate dehydrogenase/fumarate reductase flavoprotein subunit